MDGWKRGTPYAMVVCPLYQMPGRTSQIYQQAAARNVCLFSYSHLASLLGFRMVSGEEKAEEMLKAVFDAVESLTPSKDAVAYWTAVNRAMLNFGDPFRDRWRLEKLANLEAIAAAKEEALTFLAREREAIMRMSHEEALNRLIETSKISNRISVIEAISDNGLMDAS
jgi:hypothetical protein